MTPPGCNLSAIFSYLHSGWRDSNGFLIHRFADNSSGPDDSELYTANAEGRLASYLKNSGPIATFTYDHTGERTVTQIGSRTITDLVDNANPTGYSQVLKRTDTAAGRRSHRS